MSYLSPEDNFEESLVEVFGERAREFSSELRETLRDLWSRGRAQGLEDAETDRLRREVENTLNEMMAELDARTGYRGG